MSPRHRAPVRVGVLALAWRQFAADPWVSAGLALLVALLALLLGAVPRELVQVQTSQLVREVDALSAAQRDLTGQWRRTVIVASPEDFYDDRGGDGWAPLVDGAERVRQDQPEPLRSSLQPAQFLARLSGTTTYQPPLESGYYQGTLGLAVDPDLRTHVDLVEGDWPSLVLGTGFDADGRYTPTQGTAPVPILILDTAADELLLEVGDEVQGLVVSGTYTPKDPADPRWQHIHNGTTLGTLYNPNRGESAFATGFLAPANRGALGPTTEVLMRVWYPVDPSAVTGSPGQADVLLAQVTGFLAEQHTLATIDQLGVGVPQTPLFTTGLPHTLSTIVSQNHAMSSLVAVVALGPLGVALAVAALASRLVVHRRRPTLTIALARGASTRQLRWLLALEGLALGVPAALLGQLTAVVLVPGPTPWWQWVVTAVVAITPALAVVATLTGLTPIHRRADLSALSQSRWRWVAELAVIALAITATWRLLDRGTRGDPGGSGVDLLVTATPALLVLAACVVVLRLYPLPLAALAARLRSRATLTPFLGAARALRDPAGGLVPTLAVVLGTSMALVSAVLLSTVGRGAEVAAWQANGAAVALAGPVLSEQLRADLQSIDGVEAVGGLRDTGFTQDLLVDAQRTAIRIWVAEPQLEQVYAASGPVSVPPPQLWGQDGDPPVLTLRDAGDAVTPGDDAVVEVSGLGRVEVVGHLDVLPGADTPGNGVLVSAPRWVAAGNAMPSMTTTLIAVSPGTPPQSVADDVSVLVGTAGVVTTVTTRLDSVAQAPVTAGLRQFFVAATVVSAILTVLAIALVQLMGAAARAGLLATLRTLGLGPGQARALTLWELGPLVVTSAVVGALLGLAVPWVLVRGLDLTGLTGGSRQPDLFLDLPLLGLVLGAVLVTVLIAVTTSAWVAGRANLAHELRLGEDR